MNALYIIPILAVLILIHEIGHFVTARLVGITVQEFGIGLPPRVFGIRRGGVLYSINLIPLGGFVRVLGEDGKSEEPGSMQTKSRLQRTFFLAAGSLMNFLLAFVLITAMVGIQGEPETNVYVVEVEPTSPAATAGWERGDRFVKVAGQEINGLNQVIEITEQQAGTPMAVVLARGEQFLETEIVPREDPPPDQGRTGIRITDAARARITVAAVDPGSGAEEAGFQPGDRLVSIAGRPVIDSTSYFLPLDDHVGGTVPVVVQRDGEHLALDLPVPEPTTSQAQIETGLDLRQDVIYQPLKWWEILPKGITETGTTVKRMFEGVALLVRGEAPFQGIAGPIGMGQLTSEALEISPAPAWIVLLNIMILLSLNLAILNLLPFPALDGGRLLFVLVESIRGRRVPPEKEGIVHFVGFVILLFFMAVIAFVDLSRLVNGQSLLQ